MRKNFHLLLSLLLCISFQSCEKENIDQSTEVHSIKTRTIEEFESNQVIIRWDEDYSDDIKEILRDKYIQNTDIEINQIEYSAWDSKLELWKMDSDGGSSDINVNDLITSMSTKDFDEGDLEGFGNVTLKLGSPDGSFIASGPSKMQDHFAEASGPVIAILDSGLDYAEVSGKILYKASPPVPGVICGWDFVNDDNDAKDDFGHGTHIAKIIRDELAEFNIKPRFIPVKAFDEEGKTNLFQLFDALAFVNSIDDVDILNISAGWISNSKQPILEEILNEISENTLIICSSGNDGQATDSNLNSHYPSGADNDLILSVGGYIETDGTPTTSGEKVYGIDKSEWSNYGPIKVDLFAPFDNYFVEYSYLDAPLNLEGTSFSAAFATVRAAILQTSGTSVALWRNMVIQSGYKSLPLKTECSSKRAIIRNEIN